jgi:hypothetical protein
MVFDRLRARCADQCRLIEIGSGQQGGQHQQQSCPRNDHQDCQGRRPSGAFQPVINSGLLTVYICWHLGLHPEHQRTRGTLSPIRFQATTRLDTSGPSDSLESVLKRSLAPCWGDLSVWRIGNFRTYRWRIPNGYAHPDNGGAGSFRVYRRRIARTYRPIELEGALKMRKRHGSSPVHSQQSRVVPADSERKKKPDEFAS